LTLNTYDRAKFTWGFGQFAAHVPDGDFILFMRDLLSRPEALDYFPDLDVQNGRIVKILARGVSVLETSASTQPLMDYLNPTLAAVEDDEVVAAAKLIHWATNHEETRAMQVAHMVGVFKGLMARADRRLGLDGRPAELCCIICDILHQGRATFAVMQQALLGSNPFATLRAIGRGPKLAKAIDARPEFGGKTWQRDKAAFA